MKQILGKTFIGAVNLVKHADIIDKNKYVGYGLTLDTNETFSFPTGRFGKDEIMFAADMSSYVHDDNKKKDILILGEGPTQGLVDTTLTAEKKYSINFTATRKKLFK